MKYEKTYAELETCSFVYLFLQQNTIFYWLRTKWNVAKQRLTAKKRIEYLTYFLRIYTPVHEVRTSVAFSTLVWAWRSLSKRHLWHCNFKYWGILAAKMIYLLAGVIFVLFQLKPKQSAIKLSIVFSHQLCVWERGCEIGTSNSTESDTLLQHWHKCNEMVARSCILLLPLFWHCYRSLLFSHSFKFICTNLFHFICGHCWCEWMLRINRQCEFTAKYSDEFETWVHTHISSNWKWCSALSVELFELTDDRLRVRHNEHIFI